MIYQCLQNWLQDFDDSIKQPNNNKLSSTMKNQIGTGRLKAVFIICLISFIFSGCYSPSKIIVQDDIVYSTKRIEFSYIQRDRSFRSPLLYLEQSVVKEINSNQEATIKMYDLLALTSSGFNLDNKVFIIVDNSVCPEEIEVVEYEQAKSITPKTEEILKSDSTKVSVVTGYSESNKKITRFSYTLSEETIGKIKKADQISFRYYAGPKMLTIKMKSRYLRKLKKLVNKT